MSQEVWSDSMRSQVESAFYYTLFNSVTAKFAGQCGMVKVILLLLPLPLPYPRTADLPNIPFDSNFAFSQNMIFIIVINFFLVELILFVASVKILLVQKSQNAPLVDKHFGKLDVTCTQDLTSCRPSPADCWL